MNPIITEFTPGKKWKAYIQGNPAVSEYGDKEVVAIASLLLRLQGVRIAKIDGTLVFSVVIWICWLVLSWLMIMEVVAVGTFNGIMWGLFLILGIFGSAYASRS